MRKVKIYTTQDSPQCGQVKKYLGKRSVDYEEIDVTQDKTKAADLVKQTGFAVLPQIQIDDQFIVGFDRAKIDELLEND